MTEGNGGYADVAYLAGNPARGVSANFVALADGTIYQMLPWGNASGSLRPGDISTNAKPYYGGQFLKACLPDPLWRDPNSYIISIEIGGKAVDGPTPKQAAAVIAWAADMRSHYPTIVGAFGHADQTDQKPCPGDTPAMRGIFDAIGGHGLFIKEDDPMIYSLGGLQTAILPVGTVVRHAPHGPLSAGTITVAARFLILGYDVTGKFAEISGDYTKTPDSTPLTACAWVATSALTALAPAFGGTAPADCTAQVTAASAAGYAAAKADAIAAVGLIATKP
jgi:hypothetical protein